MLNNRLYNLNGNLGSFGIGNKNLNSYDKYKLFQQSFIDIWGELPNSLNQRYFYEGLTISSSEFTLPKKDKEIYGALGLPTDD